MSERIQPRFVAVARVLAAGGFWRAVVAHECVMEELRRAMPSVDLAEARELAKTTPISVAEAWHHLDRQRGGQA